MQTEAAVAAGAAVVAPSAARAQFSLRPGRAIAVCSVRGVAVGGIAALL